MLARSAASGTLGQKSFEDDLVRPAFHLVRLLGRADGPTRHRLAERTTQPYRRQVERRAVDGEEIEPRKRPVQQVAEREAPQAAESLIVPAGPRIALGDDAELARKPGGPRRRQQMRVERFEHQRAPVAHRIGNRDGGQGLGLCRVLLLQLHHQRHLARHLLQQLPEGLRAIPRRAAEERRLQQHVRGEIADVASKAGQPGEVVVVKYHRHAVARQLQVALDSVAGLDGALERAARILDHPDRPVMQAAMGDRPVEQALAHQSSITASISTAAPSGRAATPMAERACLPLSPSTPTSRLEPPLATRCCSANSGVEATNTVSFTTRLTASSAIPPLWTICDSTLTAASSAALAPCTTFIVSPTRPVTTPLSSLDTWPEM